MYLQTSGLKMALRTLVTDLLLLHGSHPPPPPIPTGLAGKTDLEAARIDMRVECADEITDLVGKVYKEPDQVIKVGLLDYQHIKRCSLRVLSLVLSGGFTSCWYLRPSSGREHSSRRITYSYR